MGSLWRGTLSQRILTVQDQINVKTLHCQLYIVSAMNFIVSLPIQETIIHLDSWLISWNPKWRGEEKWSLVVNLNESSKNCKGRSIDCRGWCGEGEDQENAILVLAGERGRRVELQELDQMQLRVLSTMVKGSHSSWKGTHLRGKDNPPWVTGN